MRSCRADPLGSRVEPADVVSILDYCRSLIGRRSRSPPSSPSAIARPLLHILPWPLRLVSEPITHPLFSRPLHLNIITMAPSATTQHAASGKNNGDLYRDYVADRAAMSAGMRCLAPLYNSHANVS